MTGRMIWVTAGKRFWQGKQFAAGQFLVYKRNKGGEVRKRSGAPWSQGAFAPKEHEENSCRASRGCTCCPKLQFLSKLQV